MASNLQGSDQPQISNRLRIALLILLAAFFTILCSFITLNVSADSEQERNLPIDVHSGMFADYSADPRQ
ncbi:MAG: hypothetical protein PVI78_13670, partial [Anaerolineales bacterium]